MKKLKIFFVLMLSVGLSQAQIQLIKDINPGTSHGPANWNKYNTEQLGDHLFFWANDGQHGVEPWVTDGTENGTFMLADIWPGTGSSGNALCRMISMNNAVYFMANDSTHGMELWKYEIGSVAPELLADMVPGEKGSFPDLSKDIAAMAFQDRLYFNGSDKGKNLDRELWCTDGDSVYLLKDIHPGQFNNLPLSSTPSDFLLYEDHLYFAARGPNGGREVWRTDGNRDSTWRVVDIWPGKNDGGWNGPVVFQGEMYFVGRYGLPGSTGTTFPGFEIWKSDGTEAGTQLLKNIHPSGNGIDFHLPYHFVEYDQHLYFLANDSVHGFEMWKTDGTANGTQLLKDIHPGSESVGSGWNNGNGLEARVLQGKLYFMAFDSTTTNEKILWETDGSEMGTQRSLDSWIGPMQLNDIVEYQGRFFSPGSNDVFGWEAWWSDALNTAQPIQDLQPGVNGSFTRKMYILNDRLVFPAQHPQYGLELLRADPMTVALEKAILPQWRIYPNPSQGELNIESEKRIQSVSLMSLNGVLMQSFEVAKYSTKIKLPAGLPKGLYLMQIQLEEQRIFYQKILLDF